MMKKKRTRWTEALLAKEARKFRTRKEFKTQSSSAYNAAHRRRIIDKICAHMEVKQRVWTADSIRQEARRHSSLTDFWQTSAAAARNAKKLGIFDSVTAHMIRTRNPPGFWTKEKIGEEAARFDSKKRFASESPSAYRAAVKLGVVADVCAHMKPGKRSDGYWQDKANILNEAKKFGSRSEFQKGSPQAARAVSELQIQAELDEVLPRKTTRKWTKQTIEKAAFRHETWKDFRNHDGGAYNAARDLGILDEIGKHLKNIQASQGQWQTLENLSREAKKYTERKKFARGSPGAYGAAFDMNVLDEICAHMVPPEYTAMARYIYVLEFSDKSVYIGISYNPEKRLAAHITGKRNKKKQKASTVHRKIKSGTPYEFKMLPEKLIPNEVAEREEEKIDEYRRAEWTILNKAKGGSLGGRPIYWSRRAVTAEARKYKYRRDFKEGSPSAYYKALSLGILQDVCSHMPKRAPTRKKTKSS